MRTRWLIFILAFSWVAPVLAIRSHSQPTLTVAQIVQKNILARGGLAAWRAIDSITMTGKISIGNSDPEVSFLLQVKRPKKVRIEVRLNGQTAIHVYDGQSAWKLVPFLNRYEAEPYPDEEMNDVPAGLDLDGPLMDYEAKGIFVDLEGVEKIESRDAYRLRLTMKDGTIRHIWVDCQSFLDLKVDSAPRRFNGKLLPVETFYRDYRRVDGLLMPYLFETSLGGVAQTEKVAVESIAINPRLDDRLFQKPD